METLRASPEVGSMHRSGSSMKYGLPNSMVSESECAVSSEGFTKVVMSISRMDGRPRIVRDMLEEAQSKVYSGKSAVPLPPITILTW